MSDPDSGVGAMGPVLDRLDAIVVALQRIADSLEAAPARPAAPAAARPLQSTPASSPSAAPAVASGAVAAAALASLAKPAPVRVARPDAAEASETAEITEVRPLLSAMFSAAMLEEKEDTWVALQALTHPDELVAPRALAGFIGFSWAKLRRNVGLYLETMEDADSFRVARTVPVALRPDEDRIKVFLLREDEMPVPVSLRRDAAADGAWRLSTISL